MQRTILPLALSLLLLSCTPASVIPTTDTQSSSSSSSVSSMAEDVSSSIPPISELEFGDSNESPASSSEQTSVDNLPERLLSSGVLELGQSDAPHTLTIFTHHSCTYCRDTQQTLLPQVIQPFIDSGDLRVQIVLLTLEKYPESTLQAKALFCAASQQKGLLMHALLTQKDIKTETALLKETKAPAFDEAAFSTCLKSPESDAAVQTQAQMAQSVNVTLVPSFLLDQTLSVGYPEAAELRADLEQAINE